MFWLRIVTFDKTLKLIDMYKYIFSILLGFIFFSCGGAYDHTLTEMGKSVKQHIRYNDEKNNIKTNIEILKPISYEEVPVDQRVQPDDVYLCKVYLRANWAYVGSSRLYNTDDTLNCYFDKNKVFVRIDTKK